VADHLPIQNSGFKTQYWKKKMAGWGEDKENEKKRVKFLHCWI
jgi:hypothetical protein